MQYRFYCTVHLTKTLFSSSEDKLSESYFKTNVPWSTAARRAVAAAAATETSHPRATTSSSSGTSVLDSDPERREREIVNKIQSDD